MFWVAFCVIGVFINTVLFICLLSLLEVKVEDK